MPQQEHQPGTIAQDIRAGASWALFALHAFAAPHNIVFRRRLGRYYIDLPAVIGVAFALPLWAAYWGTESPRDAQVAFYYWYFLWGLMLLRAARARARKEIVHSHSIGQWFGGKQENEMAAAAALGCLFLWFRCPTVGFFLIAGWIPSHLQWALVQARMKRVAYQIADAQTAAEQQQQVLESYLNREQ